MRSLILSLLACFMIMITGCSITQGTTIATTQQEDPFTQLWDNNLTSITALNSYSINETDNATYTTSSNPQSYVAKIQGFSDIAPDYQKTMLITSSATSNTHTSDTVYTTISNNKYYLYQDPGVGLTKDEIDKATYDEGNYNEILDFLIHEKPMDVTVGDTFVQNDTSFITYNTTFKLSDLATKFQDILEFDINTFLGTYDYNLIKDIVIPETIIFNQDQNIIDHFHLDLTPLMVVSCDNANINVTITNDYYELYITNLNAVTKDVTILNQAIMDDYSNDNNDDTSIELNQTLTGKIDYRSDVDVFKLTITDENKYLFTTDSTLVLNIDVYDTDMNNYHLYDESSVDKVNNFTLDLTPGDYYVYIHMSMYVQGTKGTYSMNVTTASADDYSDTINGPNIGNITDTSTINASSDNDHDYDVYKFNNLNTADIIITPSNNLMAFIYLVPDDFNSDCFLLEYYGSIFANSFSVSAEAGYTMYLVVASTGYVGNYSIQVNYDPVSN